MSKNKNASSSEYSWIIEAITEEPQLPILTLINNFGGKDTETLDFSGTLEEIQSKLHYNLTMCLDKNLESSMDTFFELDNLKPEIELLNESEQYLADGMKHSMENFRSTMEEYNQLVRAKQNLDDVITEVKNCLELMQGFQKIEKLVADNDFYRAALTMERLRARIATFEQNYQFVHRLEEALDKLSTKFNQEVIESICRFLLQLSHKLQDIGEDVLVHGWACDPNKFVDFTELAHAKLISKTFSFEEQLDVGLQVQADLLLNHVCKSATATGAEQFFQQILGFFIALIATASIAKGATFFMLSLWQTAVLQIQTKIDQIRDANQIRTTSQCEQVIVSLVELIKFSQWYCLPNDQLQLQMEKLFNQFCCFYMQERFDKLIIAEKLHSFSIFGNLEKMIECVDSIKNPDFENHNLNSDMLDKFWNDKKPKILRKVITKGLKSVIELQLEQISRKPKMFGRKICSIWDEVAQINEQKELLESWDFLEEELQVEKEALKDTLRLSVESSLKTVFQALNGVDCNLDDILSESSNSQSGALFDLTEWLKDEMHVYSNHTNLLLESVKTFLRMNLDFAGEVFWHNQTIKLQHLDALANYARSILPIIIATFKEERYLISTEIDHILELMKHLGSDDYTGKAAVILNSLAKLFPDQFTVPVFVSRLLTLKDNSGRDKVYSKSKRGKEELKLLNNLIKAVNRLKK